MPPLTGKGADDVARGFELFVAIAFIGERLTLAIEHWKAPLQTSEPYLLPKSKSIFRHRRLFSTSDFFV
jgi:hypothetical protein